MSNIVFDKQKVISIQKFLMDTKQKSRKEEKLSEEKNMSFTLVTT